MGYILKIRDENGKFINIPAIVGKKGDQGDKGVGVKTVEQTTTSTADNGENVVTITLTDGKSSTFKVMNGSKGGAGDKGVGVKTISQTTTSTADGGTNVITVTLTDNTTATFQVKNGSKGATGEKPAKGTDYFTAEDKAEIVAAVKAQLITEQWTFTLVDGTTVEKEVLVE